MQAAKIHFCVVDCIIAVRKGNQLLQRYVGKWYDWKTLLIIKWNCWISMAKISQTNENSERSSTDRDPIPIGKRVKILSFWRKLTISRFSKAGHSNPQMMTAEHRNDPGRPGPFSTVLYENRRKELQDQQLLTCCISLRESLRCRWMSWWFRYENTINTCTWSTYVIVKGHHLQFEGSWWCLRTAARPQHQSQSRSIDGCSNSPGS